MGGKRCRSIGWGQGERPLARASLRRYRSAGSRSTRLIEPAYNARSRMCFQRCNDRVMVAAAPVGTAVGAASVAHVFPPVWVG